jgi:hypothetical protein
MEREYKESIYFEEVTVELVVLTSGGALDVIPPIAGEELLTEDGAVGAEERVLSAANVANVKHLSKKTKKKKKLRMIKSSSVHRASACESLKG